MRSIISIAAAFALLSNAANAQALWTWTLYEDAGSVALANEIPDTSRLAAVLECKPGSGAARVSVFPAGKTEPVVHDYRTADADFAAFVKSGKLNFVIPAGSGEIDMKVEHRAKLERFAQLCGA